MLKKLPNSTYARRTSETRSKLFTSTLGTLGVCPVRVAVRRLNSSRVWDQKHLNMLKKKLGVSRACDLHVSNKFRWRYRCFEYASNAFCARFRHVNVHTLHARSDFMRYCFCSVPQAYVRRVKINSYTSKTFSVLRFFIRPSRVWVIR